MPDRHRLAIGTLKTRVRAAPGTAADWAARMDRAMRGPVARALGEEVGRRFEGRDAVLRLRHLRLAWTPAEHLSEAAFAEQLARRIAEAVAAAIAAGGQDARIWPDHAAYAAAYVRHRLGLDPDAAWAFPDFAALEALTAPEAATETLLAGGPPVLVLAARTAAEAGALADRLGEDGCLRLLGALSRAGASAGAAALIAEAGAVIAGEAPDLPERGAVAALARLLAPQPGLPAAEGAARLPARALLLLAREALHRLAGRGLTLRRIAGIAAGGQAEPALAPALVAALKAAHALPELWLRLTRDLAASRPEADLPADDIPGPVPAVGRPRPGREVHSAWAGLAPLIALCPLPLATPETLRRIALDLLPDEDQPRAARDPGFGLCFPADPRRAPVLPPDPEPAAWEGQGSLAGAPPRQGFGLWADLWLARFAARLPGLQASSRDYLRREFLLKPGRIAVADQALHITLPPIPLGIVLRMSGLTGLTPPIPHLGLRLLIELER